MNRMIRHNKCLDGAKSDFYKYDWHHEGNEDRYKENETHWEIESLPLHRGISSTKFHAWFLIDRHSIVRIHILFGIILNTSMSSTKAWHGPRHAINSYAFRHETWTNRRQHRTHNKTPVHSHKLTFLSFSSFPWCLSTQYSTWNVSKVDMIIHDGVMLQGKLIERISHLSPLLVHPDKISINLFAIHYNKVHLAKYHGRNCWIMI